MINLFFYQDLPIFPNFQGFLAFEGFLRKQNGIIRERVSFKIDPCKNGFCYSTNITAAIATTNADSNYTLFFPISVPVTQLTNIRASCNLFTC